MNRRNLATSILSILIIFSLIAPISMDAISVLAETTSYELSTPSNAEETVEIEETNTEEILCEVCKNEVCTCEDIDVASDSNATKVCKDCNREVDLCICDLDLYDQIFYMESLKELKKLLYSNKSEIDNFTEDEVWEVIIFIEDTYYETDELELYEELTQFIMYKFPDMFGLSDTFDIDGVIYFDLYRGSVTINNGTYTGYIYNSATGASQKVTGTHSASNKYYVFQSKGETTVGIIDGNIVLPTYNRVMVGNKTWAEYVTGHASRSTAGASSCEEVIAQWGETKFANNTVTIKTNKSANDAGRKPTANYIQVVGTGSYDITIDNVWSGRHTGTGTGAETVVYGGFNFVPTTTNVSLNLHYKGDNRFGNIHCATHDGRNSNYGLDPDHTNVMSIIGDEDATLTVCNTEKNTKLIYTAAAIGGTDNWDHTVKLIFDGGTVYAANGYNDFGTAIGGGGNGPGYVTINGGNVTAIASSTGTAIGGGCGTSGPGGYGNVTINGGNVYAYNYQPCGSTGAKYSDALPTAIGGGSSGIQIGGVGIVNINGGYVYAYSQVGNAIGGGGGGRGLATSGSSYYSATGGVADISITGGEVDAISGKGCAIGGGPGNGSAYTNFSSTYTNRPTDVLAIYSDGKVRADGGAARLSISGDDTVVRSGSIGGGSPLFKSGTNESGWGFGIGAAIVDIDGGNIYGQIIMQGTVNDTFGISEIDGLNIGDKSKFTMTDGIIDNTDPDNGNNYLFIKDNGGAVYVKDGDAIMSGGTIRDCEAVLGGIFYVEGGNVTISGDDTLLTTSSSDKGGAIYVADGDITLRGGNITNNEAPNGGAIFALGGNITIYHSTINENDAIFGGAVYLDGDTSTYVRMYSGQLCNNEATDDGGAIYITSGNLLIGKEDCLGIDGENEDHTSGDFGIHHPIIHNNKAADCGGGILIADEGAVHFYCGSAVGNEALYKGVGKNVFMDGGEFYFYDGTNVGLPRDPDLVIIGGELHNMCKETTMIKLKYNRTNEVPEGDDYFEGLAELNEYMNLPDAEYFWDVGGDYKFIGWTSSGYSSSDENKVIRDKDDYKQSGIAIQISDTSEIGGAQGTFDGTEDDTMHLYALWAPRVSNITYINGATLEDVDLVDDGDTVNPLTYEINERDQTITLKASNVSRDGFDVVGWYIYQSQEKNGNWSEEVSEGVYKAYEPVYKSKSTGYENLNFSKDADGTSAADRQYMKYYKLSAPNEDLELTIDSMTFGDVYLVADYDVKYSDLTLELGDVSVLDVDQTHVFNVKCNSLKVKNNIEEIANTYLLDEINSVIEADVDILLMDDSIKINHLAHGEYDIESLDKWAWRYQNFVDTITLDDTSNNIMLITSRLYKKWLDFNKNILFTFMN